MSLSGVTICHAEGALNPRQEVSLQNSPGKGRGETTDSVTCKCLIRRHRVQQLWGEIIGMFNRGTTFPVRSRTDNIRRFDTI